MSVVPDTQELASLDSYDAATSPIPAATTEDEFCETMEMFVGDNSKVANDPVGDHMDNLG